MREARDDLRIERIFGREWWGKDGIWMYEVIGEGEEVTFDEVAKWHPFVKKWGEEVEEEMQRAAVRKGIFEGVEWERGRMEGGTQEGS